MPNTQPHVGRAEALATTANRGPRRAVLFYATDDRQAAATIGRLISAAGFDAVKAGGVDASLRIEVFGDLHQFGGLKHLRPRLGFCCFGLVEHS